MLNICRLCTCSLWCGGRTTGCEALCDKKGVQNASILDLCKLMERQTASNLLRSSFAARMSANILLLPTPLDSSSSLLLCPFFPLPHPIEIRKKNFPHVRVVKKQKKTNVVALHLGRTCSTPIFLAHAGAVRHGRAELAQMVARMCVNTHRHQLHRVLQHRITTWQAGCSRQEGSSRSNTEGGHDDSSPKIWARARCDAAGAPGC